MAVGLTAAHVFSYEKLGDVQIDPKTFGQTTPAWDRFALLILEKDTGRIRLIHLDQERVTKVSIEAPYATPELMLKTISLFEQHKLSIIYSKHTLGNTWRLDVFIRETDVSSLVLDLEKIDGIGKTEVLELCATS